MSYPTDLIDDQWAVLDALFAERAAAKRYLGGRPRRLDLRQIMNAVLYQARTGCQWRMLPQEFPAWQTVRYYFDQWTADGTLIAMNDALRRQVRRANGRDAEPTAGSLDSQSTKTTEAGGERGYDGGKKVTGRKRHIAVDTQGNLLAVVVHAANLSDRDGAWDVLDLLTRRCPTIVKLWVDGGYTGLIVAIEAAYGVCLEVVSKRPDQHTFEVLPRRWVVERTFAWPVADPEQRIHPLRGVHGIVDLPQFHPADGEQAPSKRRPNNTVSASNNSAKNSLMVPKRALSMIEPVRLGLRVIFFGNHKVELIRTMI